jgi:hypothetical protein
MSEPDRKSALASVLREQARVGTLGGFFEAAQEASAKLERSGDNYESAEGYLAFAKGDFTNAADELAADPHSPLALQQLALAEDKLGDTAAAESTRTRLKYMRAPTVEWYLVTHAAASGTH